MVYQARIEVVLRPSILDPQGKATQQALQHLGFDNVTHVRIGKHIVMMIEASSEAEARETAKGACEKVLANAVMEDFSIEIQEVEAAVA